MGDGYARGCLRRGEEYGNAAGAQEAAPTGGEPPTGDRGNVIPWLSYAASGGHVIADVTQDTSYSSLIAWMDIYNNQGAL